jgi:hypothetical protein
MSSQPKPVELHLGTPESFDRDHDKAQVWITSIRLYLLVNDKVYNTNAKQVAFALSYMKEGMAFTWAATY